MNRVMIPGFSRYDVDDAGNIYRKGSVIPLKPTKNHKGYLRVSLSGDDGSKTVSVHSIVLSAFVGPRPEGFHGCHKDGCKSNNVLSNLKWASASENEADKLLHGTKARGSRAGAAKLTEEQVKEIHAAKASGQRTWGCEEMAKRFGVARSTITDVASGVTWVDAAIAASAAQKGGEA